MPHKGNKKPPNAKISSRDFRRKIGHHKADKSAEEKTQGQILVKPDPGGNTDVSLGIAKTLVLNRFHEPIAFEAVKTQADGNGH